VVLFLDGPNKLGQNCGVVSVHQIQQPSSIDSRCLLTFLSLREKYLDLRGIFSRRTQRQEACLVAELLPSGCSVPIDFNRPWSLLNSLQYAPEIVASSILDGRKVVSTENESIVLLCFVREFQNVLFIGNARIWDIHFDVFVVVALLCIVLLLEACHMF
jgi:hypothetical protein